jgi:hypothetical protein
MSELPEGFDLIKFADEHLDRTFDRVDKGIQPVWQGQTEFSKTLIALSSTTLVLSISVAQFLASKVSDPSLTWLLPLSWILLTLTVLLGALRHSWASVAQGGRTLFEAKRGELRKALWELPPGPDLSERFDALLAAALEEAAQEPRKAIRIHDKLGIWMFYSFALALIALVLFAIVNLPF